MVHFDKLKLANMGSLQYGHTMVILKKQKTRNDFLEFHAATQEGPKQPRVKRVPTAARHHIIVLYISTCPRDWGEMQAVGPTSH